ncbi:MAG: helix-turn-helix domain-containing protein [Actinomycetota bacterium]
MNATGTGIGRVLKRARELRGKSLEEASRETRIRAEYLQALEREAFDRLLGDVYVRGFLRSYASYLGLDADRIMAQYSRTNGRRPAVPTPARTPTPASASDGLGLPLIHRRAHWGRWATLAVVALVAVGVVAIASRPDDAPPVDLPAAVSVEPSTPPVVVNLVTVTAVDARVVVDGELEFEGRLARGEARSFQGAERVELFLASGESVQLTVNGFRVGRPGVAGQAYEEAFSPEDYRGSPSSGG